MATYYEGTPSFDERILGAPLIISGRVEKAVDVETDYSGEQPQVQTIFRVQVENVMKGQVDEGAAYVHVRVVGGRTGEAETQWTVPLTAGEEVLLMLSPDYAPERSRREYVPYFSSGFKVTAKGEVELDSAAAEEFAKTDVRRGAVSLADVRARIAAALMEREKREARLAEMEPAEFRDLPYGDIAEMPGADPGEARSASPESEPEQAD